MKVTLHFAFLSSLIFVSPSNASFRILLVTHVFGDPINDRYGYETAMPYAMLMTDQAEGE